MASIRARKPHPFRANNLFFDTSGTSIASNNPIERSPKYRHRILSSTLKSKNRPSKLRSLRLQIDLAKRKDRLSRKRRFRYDKLLHHTQIINRQYMMTMTNILFQMQKQLGKLKRRTNRVEQLVIRQATAAQPIIRIPRLTKGLKTIEHF